MKKSVVVLLALLAVSAFSGQVVCAAVATPAAQQPVYQADGEGRTSMFETDVEKIQLGTYDSAAVADAKQPASPSQQPVGQPVGQPAVSGWQPMGQSSSSAGQSAAGQSAGERAIQPAAPLDHTQAGSGAPAVTPNIPLGNLDESNVGLTLGTSVPKGSTWQLNSFPSAQGAHPHQVYKLSPSAALTVYFDPARRRAIKISIEVVHVPTVYGAQAKSTFENEVNMAVRFGGNLFVEMESNHALAKAMEDKLSLRNASLLDGKTIDFGLTEMPIVYSARLEGGRYLLDIMGK